jgi:glycine/serine hydroxymethyltransferase
MTADDMPRLAGWMKQALDAREDETKLMSLRKEVSEYAVTLQLPA